ncbi:MAG: carboxypeptidase regulatory-like domain-containing protein [Planctomycetes bacterium]|nr:carboxypeptidase regulatory-like domain-containing protein [Planctomycetota bacterium]
MKQYLLLMLITLGLLPFVGCSTPAQDISRLKEELKQEILAELRQQRQTPEQTAVILDQEQMREQMKAEIEQEILAKIQNQVQSQVQKIASDLPNTSNRSIQWQAVPIGSAQGQILRNGQGLAECKIKLIRILKPQSVVEMFNTIREGAEFTTVTDEQGKYVFEKIPVGAYKLKWQLPNDTGWIRRLRDKPDAIIAEGQTAVLKSVETSRRLVGQ